jgi:NAD+ synthase (glutamine-hydrolysing)
MMKKYGFLRTAIGVPKVKVADVGFNVQEMIEMAGEMEKHQAAVGLFPELSVTAYTCGDLFAQSALIRQAETGIKAFAEALSDRQILAVVGAPIPVDAGLYNCAVVIQDGRILGAVPKTHLPNSHEFYERRWFAPASSLKGTRQIHYAGQDFKIGRDLLFCDAENRDIQIGIEICEDLWAPMPPSGRLSAAGATVILNPSSSNELIAKSEYREELVRQQSARCNAAYLYTSCGIGESTTDLVFGGDGYIYEKGTCLAKTKRFSNEAQVVYADVDIEGLVHDRRTQTSFSDEDSTAPELDKIVCRLADFDALDRAVDASPFVPSDLQKRQRRCEEIFAIQSVGLMSRLRHIGGVPMVVGISGGLDSTLALLVCVEACDRLGLSRDHIHAVTMPGFGTTDRTYRNAVALIQGIGASFHEISIREAATLHLNQLNHPLDRHDVTYENAQARERTQILMDLANQVGGIVVGTGDLSELALGWATYNGDHMSMYAVNAGVPKTLVRYLVDYVADRRGSENIRAILKDVLNTPVSPELLPPDQSGKIAQKTEDLVGPYALHDFFLYHVVRNGYSPSKIYLLAQHAFKGTYTDQVIYKWLRNFYWRFFAQQFKRSCLPDGPKVGSAALSPRGDWRMPSDAKVKLWMDEIEAIQV